jgi:site-specific recombinase XerC
MTVHIEDKAQKQLQKLPKHLQQKTYKQLDVFLDNPKHPSLAMRKQGLLHSTWGLENRMARAAHLDAANLSSVVLTETTPS